MKLLQQKLSKYDAPQKAKALGVYPYFRAIESDQDTEVIINGKKVLDEITTEKTKEGETIDGESR